MVLRSSSNVYYCFNYGIINKIKTAIVTGSDIKPIGRKDASVMFPRILNPNKIVCDSQL